MIATAFEAAFHARGACPAAHEGQGVPIPPTALGAVFRIGRYPGDERSGNISRGVLHPRRRPCLRSARISPTALIT